MMWQIFTTVECRISSRLKLYKNYKNRLRLAKVIVKNKMSHFLWFSVYIDGKLLACAVCWCSSLWDRDLYLQEISYNKTVAPHLSSKLNFEANICYGISQPMASHRLTAVWLSCCYSRLAMTQYVTSTVPTFVGVWEGKGGRGRRACSAVSLHRSMGQSPR